jgi:hypothetical protein
VVGQLIRWLLLLAAGEFVKMSMEPTLRRSKEAVFAAVDAKLRRSLREDATRDDVNSIIRSSIYEVTRRSATNEDIKTVIALFDPTRLPIK